MFSNTYPLDGVIQPSNNRGQAGSPMMNSSHGSHQTKSDPLVIQVKGLGVGLTTLPCKKPAVTETGAGIVIKEVTQLVKINFIYNCLYNTDTSERTRQIV